MIRFFFVAIIFALGAILFFGSPNLDLLSPFTELKEDLSDPESIEIKEDVSDAGGGVADAIEVSQQILPGEQVVKEEQIPSASLTELGVFVWTNLARANNGVKPLSRSAALDSVAESKLEDMFENQYFAHESPDGDYVGDLAKDFGYTYILIGENLAYGDFETDKALVDAWMDSPGHRENILNSGYTEIGISVRRGTFNGRSTWMAVQSFGTPQSYCGSVDSSLLAEIEDGKDELEEMEDDLNEMREDIEATHPKSGPEYNSKVDAYNELVAEYNALLKLVNSWVKEYNSQINEFNECADSLAE